MYQQISDRMKASAKFAEAGYLACTVWVHARAQSDLQGRYLATPQWIKADAMPNFGYLRLEQVDDALHRLSEVRLIHLYNDAGGKRHLVFHDARDWNPGKGLQFRRGKWPAPTKEGLSIDPGLKGRVCTSPTCGAGGLLDVADEVRNVASPPPSLRPKERGSGGKPNEPGRVLAALKVRRLVFANEGQVSTVADSLEARYGVEGACERISQAKLDGLDVFDVPEVVKKVTLGVNLTAAKSKKQRDCLICRGTGMRYVKTIDPRTREEVEAAEPCDHVDVRRTS